MLTYNYSNGSNTGTDLIYGAFSAVYFLISLIPNILFYIGLWKTFKKMDEDGWKCLIPIYNFYIICERCSTKNRFNWLIGGIGAMFGSLIFVVLVPFLGVLLMLAASAVVLIQGIRMYVDMSRCFGHGEGFAAGLIFLSCIFFPILGFGSSEYLGNVNDSSSTYSDRANYYGSYGSGAYLNNSYQNNSYNNNSYPNNSYNNSNYNYQNSQYNNNTYSNNNSANGMGNVYPSNTVENNIKRDLQNSAAANNNFGDFQTYSAGGNVNNSNYNSVSSNNNMNNGFQTYSSPNSMNSGYQNNSFNNMNGNYQNNNFSNPINNRPRDMADLEIPVVDDAAFAEYEKHNDRKPSNDNNYMNGI